MIVCLMVGCMERMEFDGDETAGALRAEVQTAAVSLRALVWADRRVLLLRRERHEPRGWIPVAWGRAERRAWLRWSLVPSREERALAEALCACVGTSLGLEGGLREELAEFVRGQCRRTPRGLVYSSELYERYATLCGREGREPMLARAFTRGLEGLGFERYKTRGRSAFRGLVLAPFALTDRASPRDA